VRSSYIAASFDCSALDLFTGVFGPDDEEDTDEDEDYT
jgi:hypothetical protein